MKYTILGAGGSIGNSLSMELLRQQHEVVLVSRNGVQLPGAATFVADLLSASATLQAVEGADVVFLTAGLPYKASIWADLWPKIMQNVMEACMRSGAKLIFFDNVYMYGQVAGPMTESTPYQPCSKKGEIRAKLATQLEDAYRKGNIMASIARAADLYGPYADKNSLPYLMVLQKLMQGKKAQWLVNASSLHTYTYTLDCAKSLALLAQTPDSFGQIWHIPSHNPGISGKEFIHIAAEILGKSEKFSVLPNFMVELIGLFNSTVREMKEMLYQIQSDYNFNSDKFQQRFQYLPQTYEAGIAETLEFYLGKNIN